MRTPPQSWAASLHLVGADNVALDVGVLAQRLVDVAGFVVGLTADSAPYKLDLRSHGQGYVLFPGSS